MLPPPSQRLSPVRRLLAIMACLRSPEGCPWDQEQNHQTLRHHAVEEVYELMDAIEAEDDHEMAEELGDLLLQVIFHCQLARERKAFDFDSVCDRLNEKLIRRHPHVFGDTQVKNVDQVWANWEKIKRAEKKGSRHERSSSLDGIPRHLPALMGTQKLLKKAIKAKLLAEAKPPARGKTCGVLGRELFDLAAQCLARGWSAEELLRSETKRREKELRHLEKQRARSTTAHEPSPRSRGRQSAQTKSL
ncbi:MAG: MazG family protein [Pedosphaera sp.]|nr:MazG family protein [Pedosphaera sp.]